MVRLIDADAVIKWLDAHYDDEQITVGFFDGLIKRRPTVEAVPVVRCRECIRWRHSKTNTAAKVCDWDRYEKTENDFCSWAKRKDDD